MLNIESVSYVIRNAIQLNSVYNLDFGLKADPDLDHKNPSLFTNFK